jgi:hypothetical protein
MELKIHKENEPAGLMPTMIIVSTSDISKNNTIIASPSPLTFFHVPSPGKNTQQQSKTCQMIAHPIRMD